MNKLFAGAFERIVNRLIERAIETPYYHLINNDGTPYMDRYWVVPYVEAGTHGSDGTGPVSFKGRPFAWMMQKLDIAARVHNIRSSDDDRAHHDHPWPYLTIVLRNGYWEKRPVYDKDGAYLGDSRVWHGPGSIILRSADSWHRLEVAEGKPAWTLFITGKYVQKWGFLADAVKKIKVPYNVFLGIPDKKKD